MLLTVASGDLGDFLEHRWISPILAATPIAVRAPTSLSRNTRERAEEHDARAHRACPSDPQMMERVY